MCICIALLKSIRLKQDTTLITVLSSSHGVVRKSDRLRLGTCSADLGNILTRTE